MNDMKLRLVDHSAYNVEYVEDDTLTIAVALVSCLITILSDLLTHGRRTDLLEPPRTTQEKDG